MINIITHGNSYEFIKIIQDNSVDLLCTDPPYGVSFMGRKWDRAVPPMEFWADCLRVLKPGAFAFVMSLPRQDCLWRMAANLEEAGFVMAFTSLYWAFASGFPKAANAGRMSNIETLTGAYCGFQPKPAVEVILVAMKPLDAATYVAQARANRKGVTWLDDARIPFRDDDDFETAVSAHREADTAYKQDGRRSIVASGGSASVRAGRFPANLLVSDDILNDGAIRVSGDKRPHHQQSADERGHVIAQVYGKYTRIPYDITGDAGSFSRYFDLDAWFTHHLTRLPPAVQQTFPFLLVPKPSASERNAGLEDAPEATVSDGRQTPIDNPFQRGSTLRKNTHPTVKPIKLMSYLLTLGSRPGDLVLDPFSGSGTTAVACRLFNRNFIAIEQELEYVELAQARLAACKQPDLFG